MNSHIPPPSQPKAPSAAFLPDELTAEIISWLAVKPLMRLKCVSKSWNTLISDPAFIKMHLNRSRRNPHLAVTWRHDSRYKDYSIVPFPIRNFLENPSTIIRENPSYRLNDKEFFSCVVGSCNGLLLLIQDFTFCFWNPATNTRSEFFLYFSDASPGFFKFTFGFDNSTGTYKVVAFLVERDEGVKDSIRSEVKVFNFGDDENYWRTIQSFPVTPLFGHYWRDYMENTGVYLNGTLNWLAAHNYYDYFGNRNYIRIPVEKYVIVSLDLSTELYTQLMLPRGFDEVSIVLPTVGVLMECLCFSHDLKGTHFVIWLMKDFGVQESWIQLLKISYQNLYSWEYELEFRWLRLLPLWLSENGDTLLLTTVEDNQAFIYNCGDNRVEPTGITDEMLWFTAKDYVESLVLTC